MPPKSALNPDRVTTVTDELSNKYKFSCSNSLLEAFNHGLRKRLILLDGGMKIPAQYWDPLHLPPNRPAAMGGRAYHSQQQQQAQKEEISEVMIPSAPDIYEPLAHCLYAYATFEFFKNTKIVHELQRDDHEDNYLKRFCVVRFNQKLFHGTFAVMATLGVARIVYRHLVILSGEELRQLHQQLFGPSDTTAAAYRLLTLSHKKYKMTDGDFSGEWTIEADLCKNASPSEGLAQQQQQLQQHLPPRSAGSQTGKSMGLILSVKSRSDMEKTIASTVISVPDEPEEEDDIPDDVEFTPLHFLQGLAGATPLPRDPARYPLPKPWYKGPQLSDIPERDPVHKVHVELLAPKEEDVKGGGGAHYKFNPLRVHINQGSSSVEGHFELYVILVIHCVKIKFEAQKNTSLQRRPEFFFVDKEGKQVMATNTRLGQQVNNDDQFPQFYWTDLNFDLGEEQESARDAIMAIQGTFCIPGKAGRDNLQRSRVPSHLPQPFCLSTKLVEEANDASYLIEMQKYNPARIFPNIESFKRTWSIQEEFFLFVFVDDAQLEERHVFACYLKGEEFELRSSNGTSLSFDLASFNKFAYIAAKSGEEKVPISNMNRKGDASLECFMLIDRSAYPPMPYAIEVTLTSPTSSAYGACHIALKGNDWIKKPGTASHRAAEQQQQQHIDPNHQPADSSFKAGAPIDCSMDATVGTASMARENSGEGVVAAVGEKHQPLMTAAGLRTVGPSNRYTIMVNERLGSGGFGTVYKGFDNEQGHFVAVKECHLSMDSHESRKFQQAIQEEFDILLKLSHKNIVHVECMEATETALRVYMEWMPSGSVSSIIRRTRHRLHEGVVRRFAIDALEGLAYLHSHNVIHLDVKPANLLVAADGSVKLADFGTSRLFSSSSSMSTQRVVGTPAYMPPEMIHTGKAHPSSDMWSLACSIVEMASGKMPWSHLEDELFGEVGGLPLMFHIGSARPPEHCPQIPSHLSSDLRTILQHCFSPAAASRPTAASLLKDRYFSSASLPADTETQEHFQKTVVSEANSSSSTTASGGGHGAGGKDEEGRSTERSSWSELRYSAAGGSNNSGMLPTEGNITST